MKSTTKILLFSLCFLTVLSCRKEKSFTVKVYNPVTGEGIPNSTVYITETANSSNCLYCSPDAEEFYNGVTDENGMLVVDEDFHKNYKYDLYIGTDIESCYTYGEHEGHKASGPKISLDNKDLAGSTVYYEVVPCAYLKFYIKNENCQGTADNIKIIYKGSDPINDDEHRIDDVLIDLDGCVDLLENIWVSHPMGTRYYQYIITQGSNQTIINDTVHLNENEYVQHDIIY